MGVREGQSCIRLWAQRPKPQPGRRRYAHSRIIHEPWPHMNLSRSLLKPVSGVALPPRTIGTGTVSILAHAMRTIMVRYVRARRVFGVLTVRALCIRRSFERVRLWIIASTAKLFAVRSTGTARPSHPRLPCFVEAVCRVVPVLLPPASDRRG